MTVSEIIREIQDLPAREQEEVVRFTIGLTLPPERGGPEIEEAWEQEIQARMEAVDSGRVTGIPWRDVLQTANQRLTL